MASTERSRVVPFIGHPYDEQPDLPLAHDQVLFAMRCMSRWLRIRVEHESRLERARSGELLQVAADVDHSALLKRLLSGKEPLQEPPPLDHSYPVYPD